MNALGERALVLLLRDDSALADAVGVRITWDDAELDPPFPALTLRLLATAIPGQLASDSELRNPLIELAAHGTTSGQASETLDLAIAALAPYYNGTTVTVGETAVTFSSIRLTDVQQSRSPREGLYRKVALYSLWQ